MVALFATLTFTLTSCGDDDDEPSDRNIEGTWKITGGLSYELGIVHYLQFRPDGTFTEVNIEEDGVDVIKANWTLEGDQLTIITYDEELGTRIPVTATVNKVTNSELVLTVIGVTQTYKKVADSEINKYLK